VITRRRSGGSAASNVIARPLWHRRNRARGDDLWQTSSGRWGNGSGRFCRWVPQATGIRRINRFSTFAGNVLLISFDQLVRDRLLARGAAQRISFLSARSRGLRPRDRGADAGSAMGVQSLRRPCFAAPEESLPRVLRGQRGLAGRLRICSLRSRRTTDRRPWTTWEPPLRDRRCEGAGLRHAARTEWPSGTCGGCNTSFSTSGGASSSTAMNGASGSSATSRSSWPTTARMSGRTGSCSISTSGVNRSSWRACRRTTSAPPASFGGTRCIGWDVHERTGLLLVGRTPTKGIRTGRRRTH